MGTAIIVILSILFVFLIIYVIKAIKIVHEKEVMIIETFGKYKNTLTPGLWLINPITDQPRAIIKMAKFTGIDGRITSTLVTSPTIDLRETVLDFPRQNVITKDNVTISINALLYFQIIDAKKALYSIENLPDAIEKLTQTNLRNLVGQLALDETLTSRDIINDKLREILDKATDKWGVKVNRVELQDIVPPSSIQNAMEKEKKAEQDRRARIKEAEGIKLSAVLTAEGEKEAAINRAEGFKQAEVLKAQGIAQARVIQATAEKEALERVAKVFGDLQNARPDQYLIAMKYLETLGNISADGNNNKVVYLPYEATGILSSIDGIKEMFHK